MPPRRRRRGTDLARIAVDVPARVDAVDETVLAVDADPHQPVDCEGRADGPLVCVATERRHAREFRAGRESVCESLIDAIRSAAAHIPCPGSHPTRRSYSRSCRSGAPGRR